MNILILEDNSSIMSLMRMILKPMGHKLLESATAEEALTRFEEIDRSVDLLIADVNLPDSSGVQVAMQLRSVLPRLRIILTSGYPPGMWNDQDNADYNELPSDCVMTLQKPFLPAALLDCVSRSIGDAAKAARR